MSFISSFLSTERVKSELLEILGIVTSLILGSNTRKKVRHLRKSGSSEKPWYLLQGVIERSMMFLGYQFKWFDLKVAQCFRPDYMKARSVQEMITELSDMGMKAHFVPRDRDWFHWKVKIMIKLMLTLIQYHLRVQIHLNRALKVNTKWLK